MSHRYYHDANYKKDLYFVFDKKTKMCHYYSQNNFLIVFWCFSVILLLVALLTRRLFHDCFALLTLVCVVVVQDRKLCLCFPSSGFSVFKCILVISKENLSRMSLSSTFKLNNGIFMLRHMSAASLVASIEFRLGSHNWKWARDHFCNSEPF